MEGWRDRSASQSAPSIYSIGPPSTLMIEKYFPASGVLEIFAHMAESGEKLGELPSERQGEGERGGEGEDGGDSGAKSGAGIPQAVFVVSPGTIS